MRTAIATLLLCAGSSATGCMAGPGNAGPGDITFKWDFEGKTCALAPEVHTVHVQIPGKQLDADGKYPCQTAGRDGVALLDFAAGSYGYTIEGLAQSGDVLYNASGTVDVAGDVVVEVHLSKPVM